MHAGLGLILRRDVVGRSTRVALLVGTLLVLINHGDSLLAGRVTVTDCIKMLMTYCVPYCVSTYASVFAILGESGGRQ